MMWKSSIPARLVAICLLFLAGRCNASKVIDLTTADFEEKTNEGTWIIKFYAPWCGHCKRLAPTYDKLAEELADEADVFVAKVDGPENQGLTSRFGVRGFPSLFSVREGEVRAYEGPRTLQKLKNFVLKGHEEVEPLSWHASPLGPIGRIKGKVVDSAMVLNDVHNMLQNDYGFSQQASSIIVIASIIIGVLVAMMVCLCGVFAMQPANGVQQQRPHQD